MVWTERQREYCTLSQKPKGEEAQELRNGDTQPLNGSCA